MQALGYILLARILFATLVLDQISQAGDRRLETVELSEARQSVTKTSVEVKTLFGTQNGNGMGALIGARFSSFISSGFFLGGGGYAGRLLGSGLGADTIGYGGVIAGLEIPITEFLSLEGSTLFGFGGAKYQSAAGPAEDSSFVMEPQVALLTTMAKGVRVGGQVSYLTFSKIDSLSGLSFSVFIDFRRFNISLPE